MAKILILGGYGAVGREAATALLRHTPRPEVVVAGRKPHGAQRIPGTMPMRVDVSDQSDLANALNGADAVLMCAERDNARVARACLERGIDYVDVSASHHVLAAIEDLDDLASRYDATAVLSVGLAPGASNLLARHCVERSQRREVQIGVLLGSGEQHGRAALDWTLDGLGQLDGGWTMHFPSPYGTRTVRRFPFSDQYTLPHTLGLATASTGLCLDSRLTTALLTAAGRPAVARLLHRPRVRHLPRCRLAHPPSARAAPRRQAHRATRRTRRLPHRAGSKRLRPASRHLTRAKPTACQRPSHVDTARAGRRVPGTVLPVCMIFFVRRMMCRPTSDRFARLEPIRAAGEENNWTGCGKRKGRPPGGPDAALLNTCTSA